MTTHRLPGLLRFGGLALLALVYAAWALCDTLTELGGDSATYMLMARALSPFSPASFHPAGIVTGASYPPLFPALVGLLGAGFAAAHALVICSLMLAFALLYRLLRAQSVDPGLATAGVALFAVLPGTYLLALNIWSENPCLALSLLALLALDRIAGAPPASEAQGAGWLAAFAAAAAVMTRTAGLPLLLTVSVFVLLRKPRRWPWMIAAGWTPFVAWSAATHLQGGGSGLYVQQLLGQYTHDPLGHLSRQLWQEAQALLNAWLAAWLGAVAPVPLILLVRCFGVLCLGGWGLRLIRGEPDAIYTLLYLLMLLVWPWPGEAPRLLYALLPLVIGYGLHTIQALTGLLPRRTAELQAAAVLLLALVVLPAVLDTARKWRSPTPAGLELARHVAGYYSLDYRQEYPVALAQAQLIADLPKLAEAVPAADCIFQIKPSVVELLANRRSTIPPLPTTDDRTFAGQISQCRYAYVMKLQSPTFPIPYYPRDRLGTQYHVIRQLPDVSSRNGEPLAELIELQPAQP